MLSTSETVVSRPTPALFLLGAVEEDPKPVDLVANGKTVLRTLCCLRRRIESGMDCRIVIIGEGVSG